MYWNNPTINLNYPLSPGQQDPVVQSGHDGAHCLFYDPAIPKQHMVYDQTLADICAWANTRIEHDGIEGFVQDSRNFYDIANLVKLNMWIDDIKKQGIVKPMLVYPDSQPGMYRLNNGESRCRALERIDSIVTMSAFVTCCDNQAEQFAHLEPVTNFDQFAQLCGAEPGQTFMFTLTDPSADYGIYWYEYDSDRTRAVTPGESWCVSTLTSYLDSHADIKFSPEWFDHRIDWSCYSG
jgi:hypothetical protein